MNLKITLSLIACCIIPAVTFAATVQVGMVNFAFVPESITVFKGDTVLWINQSAGIHTTTSGTNGVPNGVWNSGSMVAGDSFSFVFDTLGTFPYYCTPHWSLGMTGVVVVSQTSIEEGSRELPTTFTVGQNHPNPFMSSTEITYAIDAAAATQLIIYDTNGQRIKTLIDGHLAPGSYRVTWDGRDDNGMIMPAGVYFYELRVGDIGFTKKMMLVK